MLLLLIELEFFYLVMVLGIMFYNCFRQKNIKEYINIVILKSKRVFLYVKINCFDCFFFFEWVYIFFLIFFNVKYCLVFGYLSIKFLVYVVWL